MTEILLRGCCGRMGSAVSALAEAKPDKYRIAAGVYNNPPGSRFAYDYPIYGALSDVKERYDVIVDFTRPACLGELIAFGISVKKPLVIATTGFGEAGMAEIRRAAGAIPVFYSANMSLGVSLLASLVRQAAAALGPDFNVEIIEKHHNQKLDAPSGTALMLADVISGAMREPSQYVYDRHNMRKKRDANEIGIHSVRGGSIIGEHEVIFAGRDEIVSVSHSALSREVFASGALAAAEFMKNKPAGFYDMAMLVEDDEWK